MVEKGSKWFDSQGREFTVLDSRDSRVWYCRDNRTYDCNLAAFLERFIKLENI